MALSKDEVLDTISEMSVMEIVELVEAMQEKFGVSAEAVAVQSSGGDVASAPAEEEKSEFDVMLTAVGDKKVSVIKAVRAITGLGLKEAKEVVDKAVDGAASPVKEGAAKSEAEDYKKQLEEAGASVELK